MNNAPITPDEVVRYCAARLPNLHRSGGEMRGPCPIHKGMRDSFAIEIATGQWFCHSQCGRGGDLFQLVSELSGLEFRPAVEELFRIVGRPSPNGRGKREIVATYDYTDERGVLLYQVVRFRPKDFRQRRPDGLGGWKWDLKNTRRVPYRLAALLAAPTAFVTEGEKDADALCALGLVATCNPGGAGKWRAEYSEFFRGKEVCVIPDADEAGRKHAKRVVQSLTGVASSICQLQFPGSKDAAEWIERGGTLKQLLELAEQARQAPAGAPESSPDTKKPYGFRSQDDGIWFDTGEPDQSPVHVCGPLEILACTRNSKSESWGRLLSWHDADRHKHEWSLPMSWLAGDGTAYREILHDGGLYIAPGRHSRDLLCIFIQNSLPPDRIECTARIGWASECDYVLPDTTIGRPTS